LTVSRGPSLHEPDSQERLSASAPARDAGPFGWLSRQSHRQIRLENRLARWCPDGGLPPSLDWLGAEIGTRVAFERPEILYRASGLGRPGLVVQLAIPQLRTRMALGIEIPLAHAIVDRLLGFDRSFGESRLQLTPVEWGVWTFLILRALESLGSRETSGVASSAGTARLVGPEDLTLDRVGPDSFDPDGLGTLVTVRWTARVGTVTGAVRLWVPEAMANVWLAASPGPIAGGGGASVEPANVEPAPGGLHRVPRGELASWWRAEAGFVTLPQGLKRLRERSVLPLSDSRLTGTPASPSGQVDLILDLDGQNARCRIPTWPIADSGGRLVRVEASLLQEPRMRDPIGVTKSEAKPMSQANASSSPSSPAPGALDVPVTLTVELGRVNLTVTQLGDLKPGDVVELSRHSRAPVELTSNGRLVARGELILIDTDLGVRVTNVFL
jgi:flagellar motor switch protein FliN